MQIVTIPPALHATNVKALAKENRRYLGVVYFIQQGEDGPVKIGYSADLRCRVNTLQTSNADSLHVRATLAGDRDLEAKIHGFFDEHRIRNEWFEGPPVVEQLRRAGFLGRYGV